MTPTCTATRSDGNPCRADFGLFADRRCWHHTKVPEVAEKRAAARMRGGLVTAQRFTKKPSSFDPAALPPLDSLHNAQRWLEITGRLRAVGTLSHNDLSAFARLVAEWVRAEGSRAVSEEVQALRERLEALEAGDGQPRMET